MFMINQIRGPRIISHRFYSLVIICLPKNELLKKTKGLRNQEYIDSLDL